MLLAQGGRGYGPFAVSQISRERIRALREFEAARFAELRPRGTGLLERAKASMPNGVPVAWMATLYEHPSIVVQRGSGGSFVDVDENTYLDFNLADTSMFTGYGVEPVVRAVSERVAAGPQFLLPTEDAEKSRWSSRVDSGCLSGSSRSLPPRPTRRARSPASGSLPAASKYSQVRLMPPLARVSSMCMSVRAVGLLTRTGCASAATTSGSPDRSPRDAPL